MTEASWQQGEPSPFAGARLYGHCEAFVEGTLLVGADVEIDSRGGPCKITVPPGGRLVLGRSVFLNFGLDLFASDLVQIGDYTMVGPRVFITDHGAHPVTAGEPIKSGSVTLSRNCWIGHSCCILPGVEIGENTVVGAGAVVTRSLPANVVAVGTPARPVRRFEVPRGWIRNSEIN